MDTLALLCFVGAGASAIATFLLHIRRWKRNSGLSAKVPCVTGILLAAGVALSAQHRKPSAMALVWLFFLGFLISLFVGAFGAMLVCRLFRIRREEPAPPQDPPRIPS